jgi:hypothetical protein
MSMLLMRFIAHTISSSSHLLKSCQIIPHSSNANQLGRGRHGSEAFPRIFHIQSGLFLFWNPVTQKTPKKRIPRKCMLMQLMPDAIRCREWRIRCSKRRVRCSKTVGRSETYCEFVLEYDGSLQLCPLDEAQMMEGWICRLHGSFLTPYDEIHTGPLSPALH